MPTEQQWEKIREEKQKHIERAISQRERSIAYFNSVNAAIEKQKNKKHWNWKKWEKDRDRFYEAWQNWFLENMPQTPIQEIKRWLSKEGELAKDRGEGALVEGLKEEAIKQEDKERNETAHDLFIEQNPPPEEVGEVEEKLPIINE